ncbi:alpha/beta hydrolase [Mycobacterium vicinigordonae]|uniref:Alpha/beta hydrolase n=1 Tax=Mycobacterium vicinigordonae TaxID=1719132 RepID=A0A7D6DZC9_9MYCO|nr:alpha/beta hydrolase [Mycobacterium vicinigordonae]QLL08424.1 alpha/beta hydrolase [Mycobacterium vicinigordonae]
MKRLVGVAAAGLAVAAARRYARTREAMAQVAPELRNPLLPFMPSIRHTWLLPLYRRSSRRPTPVGPGVTVIERRVGEPAVRVLITTPVETAPPRPGVLWIHGGGYVVGSPEMEVAFAARLARELGVVTVSPDYRLAPGHPFPAALDDCMVALRWMRAHADQAGIDPERLAVMGASAGGGLAAAVAQRSHDEGIPLRAQVLVYPMLDDRSTLRTDHGGRGRFVWTPESNRFGWTCYLGRAPRLSDAPPYSAPARREDLTGLPPAWIGVGELDLFYDEDVDYAKRLTASGVACTLVTVPGMYHGAELFKRKALALEEFHHDAQAHLRSNF